MAAPAEKTVLVLVLVLVALVFADQAFVGLNDKKTDLVLQSPAGGQVVVDGVLSVVDTLVVAGKTVVTEPMTTFDSVLDWSLQTTGRMGSKSNMAMFFHVGSQGVPVTPDEFYHNEPKIYCSNTEYESFNCLMATILGNSLTELEYHQQQFGNIFFLPTYLVHSTLSTPRCPIPGGHVVVFNITAPHGTQQSPNYMGFEKTVTLYPGEMALVRFIALLPVGFKFVIVGNHASQQSFLSSPLGTGQWEYYSYITSKGPDRLASNEAYIVVLPMATGQPFVPFLWCLRSLAVFYR